MAPNKKGCTRSRVELIEKLLGTCAFANKDERRGLSSFKKVYIWWKRRGRKPCSALALKLSMALPSPVRKGTNSLLQNRSLEMTSRTCWFKAAWKRKKQLWTAVDFKKKVIRVEREKNRHRLSGVLNCHQKKKQLCIFNCARIPSYPTLCTWQHGHRRPPQTTYSSSQALRKTLLRPCHWGIIKHGAANKDTFCTRADISLPSRSKCAPFIGDSAGKVTSR